MSDCIFCNITSGAVPSERVFENEHTFAFLDIRPNTKGHTLVVPKKHIGNFLEFPDEAMGNFFSVAKRVAHAVVEETHATGFNIIMNNGADAGQVVMHLHLHIIPRHEKDGVFQPAQHTQYEPGEAARLAEILSEKLR